VSYRTETATLPFESFSKGFDSYHGPLQIPEGSFPDGENLDLRSTNIHTINGTQFLNFVTTPDTGNIIWADSYNIALRLGQNPSQPKQQVPAQNVIVFATSLGGVFTYDPVSLVYTQLRTGLATDPRYWTDARFRDIMLLTNGIDPPLQYDGAAVYPLGSEPVARFESTESWATILGTGVVSPELVLVREGQQAVRFTITGAQTTSVGWVPPQPLDLATGIGGAPDFSDPDSFRLQLYVDQPTSLNTSSVVKSNVQSLTDSRNVYQSAAAYELAQELIIGGTPISPTQIHLHMFRVGSPTNLLHLEIRTDNSGAPSNTVITNGTSEDVDASTLPTSDGEVAFTFTIVPTLSASTTYWLVLKAATPVIDPANYVVVGLTPLTASEQAAINSQGAVSTWVNQSLSLWYDIFGVAGAVQLRFFSSPPGNPAQYFTATATAAFSQGWNAVTFLRSSFTEVSSPDWHTIRTVEVVFMTTGDTFVVLDDLLQVYNNSPAPSQLVAVYNGSALLADQVIIDLVEGTTSTDRVRIQTSDVGQINYYPPQNFIRVTGGTQSLEEVDRVSAMKVYAGIVVVGKPNSIFSLTGAPGQFTLSPFSTEIGIDSHRGMIESPRGLFFPHANTILALRLTSKDVLSQNVVGSLGDLDANNEDQTVGIRNDETHTLRWSFRQVGQTENTLQLWYDYYANAWLPPITAYTVKTWFNFIDTVAGTRRLCAVRYDAHIRVCDVLDEFGTATIDGAPLTSRFRLPYKMRQAQRPNDPPLSTRWVGFTAYLRGFASGTVVGVYFRAADHPFALDTKPFAFAGNLTTNPSTDTETFVDFPEGLVNRYIQVELRSAQGQFELLTPTMIHYVPTERPGM